MTLSVAVLLMLMYFHEHVSDFSKWQFNIVWSLTLCYIVFACRYGRGGVVNWVLSLSIWHPLSRLSFVMFLIEQMVMRAMLQNGEHFTKIGYVYRFTVQINYDSMTYASNVLLMNVLYSSFRFKFSYT